jgi:hypothetical protein
LLGTQGGASSQLLEQLSLDSELRSCISTCSAADFQCQMLPIPSESHQVVLVTKLAEIEL